jgi:hypothetical protein
MAVDGALGYEQARPDLLLAGRVRSAIYQAAPGTGTGATTISNIGW